MTLNGIERFTRILGEPGIFARAVSPLPARNWKIPAFAMLKIVYENLYLQPFSDRAARNFRKSGRTVKVYPSLLTITDEEQSCSRSHLVLEGPEMTVFVRFAAVALSAGSLIGCCHSSCHQNPCDPCGGHHHSHKAKKWMKHEIDAWRVRNTCDCDVCGGGGFEMSPYGAPMMDQGGGCASCSQGQGSNYAPAMAPIPELQAPVAPPAPPAETTLRVHPAMAPAQYAQGRPVPQFVQHGQQPQMAFAGQSIPVAAPQMPLTQAPPNEVSYEEFQRLPGVVTSGPGAAPQMVQQQQYTVPPANFAPTPAVPQFAAPQFVAAPAAAPVAAPVVNAPSQPIRQAAAVAPQIHPGAPATAPQAGGSDGWRPVGQ